MTFTESQVNPSKPGSPLIAALTGGSVGTMLLILMVVIAVTSFAVGMRSGKCHKRANLSSASPDNDFDLSTNYNYGVPLRPSVAKCRYSLENMYDTPNAVFPPSEKLDTKKNEAYNVTLVTVDEVTKPTQDCNSFEYDYIQ